jgi:hypothetical protein
MTHFEGGTPFENKIYIALPLPLSNIPGSIHAFPKLCTIDDVHVTLEKFTS